MCEGPLYVDVKEKEGLKFYTDSPEFSKYSEEKNIQHSLENFDLSDKENEIDNKYFNERK